MAMNMVMAMAVTKKLEQRSGGGRPRSRRTRREWLGRAGLAALVAVLGYGTVSFTLAGALKQNAKLAYALAPYDGRASARLAGISSAPGAVTLDRRHDDDLARKALRQDPVNVPAAVVLGLNAQLRGDVAMARRAFAYAERLSRRDLITQLWGIEEAVKRNDISDAVHHYDVVLRVKPEMREVLFPVLAAASTEGPVQTKLVRTLTLKPSWGEEFINYMAAKGTDPQATAALFNRLTRSGINASDTAKATLLNAFIANDRLEQAWSYYATIRTGVSRDRVRDPSFAKRPDVPTLFDWVAVEDGGIASTLERGSFSFSAPASIGGAMLQQFQLLPPGDYRFRGHSIDVDQPDDALPYWTLICKGGKELGRVDVLRSGQSNGHYAGMFRVPLDCPSQTLTLVARPSEKIAGLSGSIDYAGLEPSPRGEQK